MNVSKLAGEEDLETKIQAQIEALEAAEGFETGFEVRRSHRMADESGFIASAATELEAQLIVVGTRGRGRVAGALFGSVAQGLLHCAPCPVLVVPPGVGSRDRPAQPSGPQRRQSPAE